jgi:hypothetical protein
LRHDAHAAGHLTDTFHRSARPPHSLTTKEKATMGKDEPHQLGDAPIEDEYVRQMNTIALTLDELFNGDDATPRRQGVPDRRKTGFVLLVFPFGEEASGRCNFISNGADRKDVVLLFKEMIARFEGQPELKGHA